MVQIKGRSMEFDYPAHGSEQAFTSVSCVLEATPSTAGIGGEVAALQESHEEQHVCGCARVVPVSLVWSLQALQMVPLRRGQCTSSSAQPTTSHQHINATSS